MDTYAKCWGGARARAWGACRGRGADLALLQKNRAFWAQQKGYSHIVFDAFVYVPPPPGGDGNGQLRNIFNSALCSSKTSATRLVDSFLGPPTTSSNVRGLARKKAAATVSRPAGAKLRGLYDAFVAKLTEVRGAQRRQPQHHARGHRGAGGVLHLLKGLPGVYYVFRCVLLVYSNLHVYSAYLDRGRVYSCVSARIQAPCVFRMCIV